MMPLAKRKLSPTKAYKRLTKPKDIKMGISRKWINPLTIGWINWFCLVQLVISSSVCIGGEHTHPCRFNPECLCSTGGKIEFLFFYTKALSMLIYNVNPISNIDIIAVLISNNCKYYKFLGMLQVNVYIAL